MPRYKLTLEYDGTPFVGWQMQDNGVSVQGQLAKAIAGFCGESVNPHGAGRTDTGVHACGQVAHIDLAKDWPVHTVREALNHHLKPDPIAVLVCRQVADDFDARFSALARHYRYRIANRLAPPILDRDRAWYVRTPLDAAAMQEAADHLIGHHNFTTFRAAGCQANSPMRTLDVLTVERHGDEITVETSARSFLHHQVRSIVGSLKQVGGSRWAPDDMRASLASCDRSRCGVVAPAHGLYLMAVDYPDEK